jgi:RimJ/RimL family protein N-acetyltransferase
VRNLRHADITPAYPDWLNDPEVNRFLESREQQTVQSCHDYVESYNGHTGRALFGIFLKEPQLHIGNITFSRIDWERAFAIVGITLGRKELTGRGLAKEAMVGIGENAFEHLRLHRLQAHVAEKNLRAVRVFEECGFKVEGNLRDGEFMGGKFQAVYVFGILEGELPEVGHLGISW